MAKIVRCLMAASFMILVTISFNSPSCQACVGFWPWCRSPYCFQPPTNFCDDNSCGDVCRTYGIVTDKVYCKQPKRPRLYVYLCCCPT
ncbi:hypothetical protein HU200_052451 [Digitaria exilis]|uniref:Uncharacterized protein n=1 Tax=Digitaria exilis TaxID=1010633 RepID=A0A835AJ80_9POAL|nr:hypothetical protein HU200_052451 [Digitaria exilis]